MKTILLFIFLLGCGLNESLVNSIGEQAKDVIDKAKSQGGQKGIQTLNDEIEDLEEKIDKKESEYRRLKNRIDDKEEELDEKQDELDGVEKRLREIEERLKAGGLTPEEIQVLKDERDRLQGDKTTLEQEKQRLQDQINGLNTDKEQLEAERDQAKADLEAVKEARDDLQRQLDEALRGKRSAENRADRERDRADRERDRANRAESCYTKNICGRGRKIEGAILSAKGETDCREVNICDLWGITRLEIRGSNNNKNCSNKDTLGFVESDFSELKNLRELDLSGNCLKYLQDRSSFDFFIPDTIKRIDLTNTGVRKLPQNFRFPPGIVDGGVTVTEFIYCANVSYKRKLTASSGSWVWPHNHNFQGRVPTEEVMREEYCY